MQVLDMFLNFIRSIFGPFRDLTLAIIPESWIASLPALTLIVFAFLALLVGLKRSPLIISFIGVALAILQMFLFDTYTDSFGGLFARGPFADFFIYIILIVGFLVLMSATQFGGDNGTYCFMLLMSFAGAIWVVMATDLIGLFVAWELMSTPTYVLAALGPHRGAVDGAVKYFVMGLLSTTLLVFGIAIIFGVTGSTSLVVMNEVIRIAWASTPLAPQAYPVLLAMVMFVIAFGFKVGVFPGWMWVPDTYSTADGSVVAYLAGATKKTGVSALMRILLFGMFFARFEWTFLIVIVAILTMVIGNYFALSQNNISRMLAYSSIAQIGYLFIGIAVYTPMGAASAMFYSFVHALMKSGAFILIWAMSMKMAKEITYDDLRGLSKRAPLASALLLFLMLALAGAPLTVGLTAKWILFQSALEVGYWWLALIAALNTVYSLGYYLRVIRYSYMREPTDETPLKLPKIPLIAVTLCVVGLVVLFILPSLVLDYAFLAAFDLLQLPLP